MSQRIRTSTVVSTIFLWILGAGMLHALPRFSLLTGTRCSACHFNPQGSGIRTELGWSTMNQIGAIPVGPGELDSNGIPSSPGFLPEFFGAQSNSYFDGILTIGLDVRLEIAKIGAPSPGHLDVPRKFIPMQIAPYIAIQPVDWLIAYGGYNAGGAVYKAMSNQNFTFPGQTNWNAALLIQPEMTMPGLKLGYIQPSIGIRHDDHTMFVRSNSIYSSPVIPPDYNEFGAEINYEGMSWLTLNAGIFNAKNLAKTDPTVDPDKPSYSARAVLWPQLLDEGINGELGASYFTNGGFRMINAFVGIGLADKATLYGEGMFSHNAAGRDIRNFMVQGSYQLSQWLAMELRYEHGLTESTTSVSTGSADAFVVGAQFFPIPYVELRPEYRFLETDQFQLGQYTVQLHLFY